MSKHTDVQYDALYEKYVNVCDKFNKSREEELNLKEELERIYNALYWFPEVEEAKRKCDIPRVFESATEYANHIREIATYSSQHIAALEELILVLRTDDKINLRVDSLMESLAIPARRSDKAYETGYVLIKRKVLDDAAKQLEAYAEETDLRMLQRNADSLFFAQILQILRNH